MNTGKSQILEIEIQKFDKSPARTFEMKQRQLIYTKKDWEVQMKKKILLIDWNRCG